MARLLIVTTKKDSSLPYLLNDEVDVAYFDDGFDAFKTNVARRHFSVIYLRDPFNTGVFSLEEIDKKLHLLTKRQPEAYYVDHAAALNDLLIEDKWRQYEQLGEWMPKTVLGDSMLSVSRENIAKRRISSRSKNILFNVSPGALSNEWIIQERLAIFEELRVYYLFGEVIRTASIKRPKVAGQTTKVIGLRELSLEEERFAYGIGSALPALDFAGLDIAVTPAGLRLIEVNRSPQFVRYSMLREENLVEDFWEQAKSKATVR